MLIVTILGSGTSQGIPVIGCQCEVCQSSDTRDKRLRTAIHLTDGEQSIVIDVGPDFRQQMLRAHISNLDAILITHEHNDHIIGIDDVRPFNFMNEHRDMPIYCTPRVAESLLDRFAYAFAPSPYPGAPRLKLKNINTNLAIQLGNWQISPINYLHGQLPVVGFRVGDFAYLTDIKTITGKELAKLEQLDTLIISALHRNPHHSHLSLEEALSLIELINPRQAWLTHLSHRMGTHQAVSKLLPPNVDIVYDGMQLEFDYPQ